MGPTNLLHVLAQQSDNNERFALIYTAKAIYTILGQYS